MAKFKDWTNDVREIKLNLFEKLLLLAPIFIWFSYQPNFNFGQISGTNIEFSLFQIFLVILALSSLPLIIKNRQDLIKNKAALLVGSFVAWNYLGLFWSVNVPRTLLTSLVLSILYAVFLGLISSFKLKKMSFLLIQVYVFMATIMSLIAAVQVIYGAWTDYGLCSGCLARGFGFVRPSAFSIEPQFFGSLLIFPMIWLIKRSIERKASRFEVIMLFIQIFAMYLTLSRGAIFALALAVIVLLFSFVKDKKQFKSGLIFVVIIISSGFLSGMVFHGIFTQLNPRVSDGFYDSISKSVNQMSLGVVKLPKIDKPKPEASPKIENIQGPEPEKAAFDGYVEKSTDERTNMLSLGIETWSKDFKTILLGVGAGGAGRAIHSYTQKTSTDLEIVQNEFIEILLENGLVGFGLFIGIIFGFFYSTRIKKWAWAVFIGILVQWFFFSGLPNSLHIYLILGAMFVIINKAYEKKPSID